MDKLSLVENSMLSNEALQFPFFIMFLIWCFLLLWWWGYGWVEYWQCRASLPL